MHRKKQSVAVGAAVAAVALALAGAAVAALASRTAAAKTTAVKVTEREYRISMSKLVVPAGEVVFTVHNAGHIAHAFAVSGAGLKATVRTPTIAPGATRTLRITVRGGTLHTWCPMPGHAALGMKAALRISGGTGSTGTSPGNGTSTTPTDTYAWG